MDKCYFVLFISNTNHLCRNLLAKGLKDQRKKKNSATKLAIASPKRVSSEVMQKAPKTRISGCGQANLQRGHGKKARHSDPATETKQR